MTHLEVLDIVFANHGTNYRKLSMSQGLTPGYYYMLLNQKAKHVSLKIYGEILTSLGCRVVALTGKDMVDITDIGLNDETKLTLTALIQAYSAVGIGVGVKDGDEVYPVTSGVFNEQTKVRSRKGGFAPGSHAVSHGDGAV